MTLSIRKWEKLCAGAAMAIGLTVAPAVSIAQDDPNAATVAETARLKAETENINADTARINARTAHDQARVTGLGLPSFQGTTTLGQGVGASVGLAMGLQTRERSIR